MGMFDEIRCEHPIPDSAVHAETFQTKSLDRLLPRYTVNHDGRLILDEDEVRYEAVPEEARPCYGTREWDEHPWLRIAGMLRSLPVGDVEVAYHTDLIYCISLGAPDEGGYEWFEY